MISLNVPYYSQNDSDTEQYYRMCQSSSMAMTMEFLKPGCIKGQGQKDDIYLKKMNSYGDTTDANAHLRAMRDFGFKPAFLKNLRVSDLEKQLKAGKPIPCGILHKGPVSAPTGGGHWVVVVGMTDTHFIVNDPAGELDLVNGGYHISNNGDHLQYSRKNFVRRWECDGNNNNAYRPGFGWGYLF